MAPQKKSKKGIDQPYEIEFHQRPSGPAGEYTVEKLTILLERFCEKLRRRSPVRSVEVYIKQPKNPVGKTVADTVMLHIHLWTGKRYVASSEGYIARAKHLGLEAHARKTMKEIEEQIRREHDR